MSTSTNEQSTPPAIVTGNSFNITSNPFLLSKTARPKSTAAKQRRSKVGRRHPTTREQHQDQQQQEMEYIPLDNSTPLLQDTVIYVDKSVINRNSLMGMANALSATVLDKWATSATHLIHGPTTQHHHQQQNSQQNSSSKRLLGHRAPPIISKSLAKKMRVVSPHWLTACYNNKERMPESLYPYEMNSHHRMKSLRKDPAMDSTAAEENPFGLEPDEFATIESCDDEGGPVANDRRVTDYFQPANNTSTSDDNNTHDGQQDDDYMDGNHLDFDNDDNNNGVIIQDGDNDRLQNTNTNDKDNTNDNDNEFPADISYSLIEMSQVQPEQLQQSNEIPDAPPHQQSQQQQQQQQQQEQRDCAYEQTSTAENQLINMGLLKESTTQEHPIILEENYDDHDDDNVDDNATYHSVLPEMDPNIQPKVTLGREDRLQIWYGEQSFCLDTSMPLPSKQTDPVDLTSSTIPPKEDNGKPSTSTAAPSTIRLSTNKYSTTTKRLKKSHQ